MELSTEIKEARRKLGLSQSQAAKAWDVKLSTLQAWEIGKNQPRSFALKYLRQIIDGINGVANIPSDSSESPVEINRVQPSPAPSSAAATAPKHSPRGKKPAKT